MLGDKTLIEVDRAFYKGLDRELFTECVENIHDSNDMQAKFGKTWEERRKTSTFLCSIEDALKDRAREELRGK